MQCPECGHEDIAISVTYRKSTLCRIIRFFLLAFLCYVIVFNMAEIITFNLWDKTGAAYTTATIIPTVSEDKIPDGVGDPITVTIYTIISLAFSLTINEIFLQWIESKKRIYYVCKECEHTWFTQDTIE